MSKEKYNKKDTRLVVRLHDVVFLAVFIHPYTCMQLLCTRHANDVCVYCCRAAIVYFIRIVCLPMHTHTHAGARTHTQGKPLCSSSNISTNSNSQT